MATPVYFDRKHGDALTVFARLIPEAEDVARQWAASGNRKVEVHTSESPGLGVFQVVYIHLLNGHVLRIHREHVVESDIGATP